jgi:hypothetical protein
MFHNLLLKLKKSVSFFLYFIILGHKALAEITISFPSNRIVFQRNNDNKGFVNIIGNYSEEIDKVEAKLTPIAAGQGIETGWTVVQDKPKAGYFAGKIQGQGGWYKLEIRAIKNNSTLKTITIEKVGIGEVFIVLGQSNAQGIPNYGAKGATDDRVNAINFNNSNIFNKLPENLNFVQLSEKVNIAPQGDGPWCWGELGDRLVRRLNVPVVFFNEGLSLVSVINWRESAEGKPTFNFVLDVGGRFQLLNGLPYINLKNTLQYYGALLGVRSLLWIQGETDNSPNRLSADVYSMNLQRLIDISRNDFDEKLTWMVARTSVTYQAPSNLEIIGGQNQIINKAGNNVFAGPFTDSLQIPRLDDVHFKNVPGNMGISLLAENWDKSLDDNFFKNSKPILAKSFIEPEIECDSDNQVSIKLPEGLKSYEWSNNAKNNQITVNKETLTVAVKDQKGNTLLVPSINTNLIYPSTKPNITADKSLEFCTDGTEKIELTANNAGAKSYIWSSGETTQKISVDKSGDFTVKAQNNFGCFSDVSAKLTTKANPIPSQPKILVSPKNNICFNDKITLTVNTEDKVLWSNSSNAKTITLDTVGNYNFSVRSISDFGCESLVSTVERLSIHPIPKQPTLSQIGLFTLNVSSPDLVSNDQYAWKKDNIIFLKSNIKNLKTTQDGNYQIATLRTYQTPNNQSISCSSANSNIIVFKASSDIVTLYPNPTANLLYIETKEDIKSLEIRIYNLVGKLVLKYIADDTTERKEIDLNNLEKGSYIIRIKGDGFENSSRLIIQK